MFIFSSLELILMSLASHGDAYQPSNAQGQSHYNPGTAPYTMSSTALPDGRWWPGHDRWPD